MGKNKLKKFREMEGIDRVEQWPWAALQAAPGGVCPRRGRWDADIFGGSGRPLTLELGCGHGEYTVGLARCDKGRSFIGIDIKGARMWQGAVKMRDEGLTNAAYLRTSIELLPLIFAPGEVDELWITFPDPQMKKAGKRLTGTRMLEAYRRVLKPGGRVNLKTDSPFLYEYTRRLVELNQLPLIHNIADLHATGAGGPDELRSIRTFYEDHWLSQGHTIKYLSFLLPSTPALLEPEEPERDDYNIKTKSF